MVEFFNNAYNFIEAVLESVVNAHCFENHIKMLEKSYLEVIKNLASIRAQLEKQEVLLKQRRKAAEEQEELGHIRIETAEDQAMFDAQKDMTRRWIQDLQHKCLEISRIEEEMKDLFNSIDIFDVGADNEEEHSGP